MNRNRNSHVLAVAIDAAEPKLIHQMIEEDELPVLKSLLSQGSCWERCDLADFHHRRRPEGARDLWRMVLAT